MDGRAAGLLIATVVVVAGILVPISPAHASEICSDLLRQSVGCPDDIRSQVDNDTVNLFGSESNRSERESNVRGDDQTDRVSGGSSNDEPRNITVEDLGYLPNCPDMNFDRAACLRGPGDAQPAEDADPAAPSITITDLASFTPTADRLSAEPGDWAIAGLAINPVADGAPATAEGQLLGLPAEVRFTPVEFLWDFGDGTSLSTADGGATWSELGQPEFSDTATSHVYDQRGTYPLALQVRFTAEYAVGGGAWTPVAGTLLVDSGSFDVAVGGAGTVLVERDCRTGARGPGC